MKKKPSGNTKTCLASDLERLSFQVDMAMRNGFIPIATPFRKIIHWRGNLYQMVYIQHMKKDS